MVNLFIQYNKEYGIDLYDIIKKAIKNKSNNVWKFNSISSNFYIKATEFNDSDSTRNKNKDVRLIGNIKSVNFIMLLPYLQFP